MVPSISVIASGARRSLPFLSPRLPRIFSKFSQWLNLLSSCTWCGIHVPAVPVILNLFQDLPFPGLWEKYSTASYFFIKGLIQKYLLLPKNAYNFSMKKISDHLVKVISSLPKTPWVYQMKNESWEIIYVGKSINLKSRVSSYFQKSSDLTLAKRQMVDIIADIETISCENEMESLILETNLIKYHKPKYNILMKDDKNLVYIKVNQKSVVSTVSYTRVKKNDGAFYFGPYTGGMQITKNLPILKKMFQICSKIPRFTGTKEAPILVEKNPSPCLDYYFGKCSGICTGDISALKIHEQNIAKFIDCMRWNTAKILSDLQEEMNIYAKKLEFEHANEVKSQIEFIQNLQSRQSVRDVVDGQSDAIAWQEKNGTLYIVVVVLRSGQVVSVLRHFTKIAGESQSAIISQFLAQKYIESRDMPDQIFVPKIVWEKVLGQFFKSKKIDIIIPKKWAKKQLLDFATNQCREFAFKSQMASLEQKTGTKQHMKHILEVLGFEVPKKWPISFECYDISHTHGQFTYASRVVIKNGKPDPSCYKKYKIKTLEKGEIDDFASHREVMYRRGLEAREQENLPHLIIIDGGKWQLSRALSGLRQGYNEAVKEEGNQSSTLSSRTWSGISEKWLNWSQRDPETSSGWQKPNPPAGEDWGESMFQENFSICSIAKREEEIFIPNRKKPILFKKGSPELMILQKARDESHRFSLNANRSARTKSMKKNILEALPWIGPATRKKLLKKASSIDGIRELSENELLKIVRKNQLETLRDHGLV